MTPERKAALSLAVVASGIAASVLFTDIDPKAEDSKLGDGGWACAIPDTTDGKEVDCYAFGPFADEEGHPTWRGANTLPAKYLIGTQCIEAPCAIEAGSELKREADKGFAGRAKLVEVAPAKEAPAESDEVAPLETKPEEKP